VDHRKGLLPLSESAQEGCGVAALVGRRLFAGAGEAIRWGCAWRDWRCNQTGSTERW